MTNKLEPVDLERCQADVPGNGPFTMGGKIGNPRDGYRVRCEHPPIVIATEKEPGEDGRKGSMSLCGGCREALIKQEGDDFATFMSTEGMRNCPDCGVAPGEQHFDGCDIEFCSECMLQRMICDCEGHDPELTRWTGLFPGIAECRELGWYVQIDPRTHLIGPRCEADHPHASEDLNRWALYSQEHAIARAKAMKEQVVIVTAQQKSQLSRAAELIGGFVDDFDDLLYEIQLEVNHCTDIAREAQDKVWEEIFSPINRIIRRVNEEVLPLVPESLREGTEEFVFLNSDSFRVTLDIRQPNVKPLRDLFDRVWKAAVDAEEEPQEAPPTKPLKTELNLKVRRIKDLVEAAYEEPWDVEALLREIREIAEVT